MMAAPLTMALTAMRELTEIRRLLTQLVELQRASTSSSTDRPGS